MKQPFRYFRGEFNGAYLYALVTSPNYAVQDILDELVYHILFQWKLEDEIGPNEMPIRYKDIIDIAAIAGLFQPRSYGRASLGSTYFTQSHIVNGKERSERGLMDMKDEGFKFVRREQDEYPDDIVNEASENMRMGLVPEGTEPVGYVPLGVQLYTPEGEIIWDNVLPEPPDDGTPYTTFYGEKFLIYEEFFNKETPLTIDIFKLLLECVQKVRCNGPTFASFMEITRILGAGYIYDIEIVPYGRYYTIFYKVNDLSEITDKDRRFAAWVNICKQKFKLFVLENRV